MLLDKPRTDNQKSIKICSQRESPLLQNKELEQDFTKSEILLRKPCQIFCGITMNEESVNERNLNQQCDSVCISPNRHPKELRSSADSNNMCTLVYTPIELHCIHSKNTNLPLIRWHVRYRSKAIGKKTNGVVEKTYLQICKLLCSFL